MNKGLLLLGLGAVLCSSASAAPLRKEAGNKNDKFELAQQRARKINARNAANESVWRAGRITNYYWDFGDWTQYNEFNCSYYPNGLLKEEASEEGFRNYYEYDNEGRVISETNYSMYYGDEEEIECIKTYQYDDIIKDLVIYTYEDYPLYGYGYGNGKEITRNDLGNIVLVKNYSIWDGTKNYSGDSLIIEYNDDNVAVKITDQYTGEDWETGEPYTEVNSILSDIVWENTDGQIYDLNLSDPLSPAFLGANRIKSCTLEDLEMPCPALLSASYDGIDYNVVIELETGEKISEIKYICLDEYGSYKYSMYNVDLEEGDGQFVISTTMEGEITYVVDQFGLVLEESEAYVEHFEEGDETYSDEMKAEVTYDEVYGYPLEYVLSSKADYEDEFQLQEKIVYSDYANYGSSVGIEPVVDAVNEKVEFYNLNGLRVDKPSNGIFIRRQGDKVSKVFVK